MCRERGLCCSPRKSSEKQQLRCFLRQEAQVQEGSSREKGGGGEAEGKWVLVDWLRAEMLPEACVRDSADRVGM